MKFPNTMQIMPGKKLFLKVLHNRGRDKFQLPNKYKNIPWTPLIVVYNVSTWSLLCKNFLERPGAPDELPGHPEVFRINTSKVFLYSLLRQRLCFIKPARFPKGLRAESARAFTGRRCPQSGKGEDFLTGQLNFFTETAVIPERKVKKSFPRWEINRHAEG